MLVHLGNSPTHRVVDRALRKVGRSKQHSALMREGLERSLTHASARKDRERPCLVSLARRGWDISRSQGKQKERERTHDEDEVNRRPFSSIVRDTRAYEHEENWKNHGGSFARHTAADSFLAPVTRVSYRQSQKKKVSRE